MTDGTQAPTLRALLDYRPPDDLLRGRAILVTGGAEGIGRAVACAYGRCGAVVILVDRNRRALHALREAFVAAGWRAPMVCTMDLARARLSDLRDLAARVDGEFGRLDGLLNNAGWIGALTPFEHCDPATWGKTLSVNLAAPFFLTQWSMQLLKRSSDPAIVFSLHHAQRAHWGAYGIAKAGLEALVHILADEYHPQSAFPMRVIGVDPGPVATAERRRHYPGEPPDAHPQPDAVVGPYLYAMGPEGQSGLVLRHAPPPCGGLHVA